MYLRGEDESLRNEYVIIGAHFDHLGMGGPASRARDTVAVHHGADDNASGVAALLEIARSFAMSHARPRRTILFAFWTGEEEGKFGSSHYTRHPRWPLATSKAYLNLDMIGRDPDNILYVSGTSRQLALKPLIARAAAGAPVAGVRRR